jgi:hypothetical protein
MNHLAFKEALELLRDPQSLKRLKEHDAFPDAAQLSSTDRLFLVTDASKPPPGPEGPMYYVERMPLAPGDDANGVAAALVTRLFKPSTVRLADGHEWRVSVREYRLLENVMLSPAEQKMRHMPISVRIQAAKGDVADLEDVDGERHLLAVTAASGKGYEFSSTRLCGTSRPEGGGSRTLSLAPTAWWKSAGVDTVPLKLPNKNAPLELSKFVPRSVWRRTSAVTLYSRNLSRGAGEPVGWFASAAMPARSPPAARESPSSGREAGAEWEACDVIAKRLVSDLLASSTDAPPARGDSPPTSADASGCAAELAAHVERLEAQLQESAARLELVEAELVQQRQEATRLRQDKEALEGELSRAKRARADGPSDAPEGPQDERAPPQPRDDADGGDGDDRRRPAQAKALHRVEGQTLRRDDRVSAAAPPPPIPLTLYGGGPLPSVSPTDASWAETALARARAGAAGGAGEAVQSGGDAPPSGAVVVEEEAWPLLSARAEPKSELDAWCAAHGLPPPTYEAEALPTHTSRWLVRVHVASGPSAPAIFRTPPAAERRFKREAVAEAARVALERIDAHAAAEHFDSTRFRQVLPSAAARAQEDDLAREFQRCLRLIPRATSAAQSAAAPAAEGGHGDADASQGPAARAPAEVRRRAQYLPMPLVCSRQKLRPHPRSTRAAARRVGIRRASGGRRAAHPLRPTRACRLSRAGLPSCAAGTLVRIVRLRAPRVRAVRPVEQRRDGGRAALALLPLHRRRASLRARRRRGHGSLQQPDGRKRARRERRRRAPAQRA